ncbi:hypothetical protein E2320_000980 [Naja naja]|nr:hypothetical protein E2320_000980 [Naja naja]
MPPSASSPSQPASQLASPARPLREPGDWTGAPGPRGAERGEEPGRVCAAPHPPRASAGLGWAGCTPDAWRPLRGLWGLFHPRQDLPGGTLRLCRCSRAA